MKKVLAFAATSEAAMGLVSLVYPPIAVRLLFGSEIAGISLVALGLACWPGSDGDSGLARALRGMLCYSLLATLFLAYLGIGGEHVGSLLWPAVALHITLTFLLAGAWLRDQQTKGKKASLA